MLITSIQSLRPSENPAVSLSDHRPNAKQADGKSEAVGVECFEQGCPIRVYFPVVILPEVYREAIHDLFRILC